MNQRISSNSPPDVVAVVRDQLSALGAPADRTALVVMLSGGGDSVALLLALRQLAGPESLRAVHLNYGLRGQESEGDAEFSTALCERLGVALTTIQADDRPEGGNLQDWARDLRYAAADEIAEQLGQGARIATAHTADDQAETVLYRLFASPGRRALRGMPASRGRIVRPLLTLRRERLRAWLSERGQDWREDASNDDDRFARVRARKILSAAEELHPAAIENLLQTASDLREEGDELAGVVEQLTADLTTAEGALDLAGVGQLPPAIGGAVVREYVEQRRPVPVPKASRLLPELLRLGAGGEQRELQVEGARLAVCRGLARVIDEA